MSTATNLHFLLGISKLRERNFSGKLITSPCDFNSSISKGFPQTAQYFSRDGDGGGDEEGATRAQQPLVVMVVFT